MAGTPFKNLNVRLTEEETELIEKFRQVLQARYGSALRVTQRTVIVQALEYFGAHLQEEAEQKKVMPQDVALPEDIAES